MVTRLRRIAALLAFASVWSSSSRRTLVRCFPLNLFDLALDTTSHAEFENDEHTFRFAVKWQTLRISSPSSPSSSTAAPFVGCTDYTEGRRARIRLERMFGIDAVRTVHHSREHRSSCFLFHALHEEARELLKEAGMNGGVQLQYVAAFPANLKIAPNVLDYSSGSDNSTKTSYREGSSWRPSSAGNDGGGSPRLSGRSSRRGSSKTSGAESMQESDRLAEQRKARFYAASANSEAENARARNIESGISLPRRPRNHNPAPWENVFPKLRVKPHEDMHFLRARGLGLQLSPGALAPPRHYTSGTSGTSGHRNAKGDPHSGDGKARFEELMETWREAWTSLGRTDIHRLSIWSDPDADFQGGAGGAGAGANSNSPNKVFRSTEWRLAADKLDQMIGDTGTPTEREGFGAVCGWDEAVFRLETSDFISVTGIDSLLNGPHLSGKLDDVEEDMEDWRVACFMGLLSVFASAHEVLQISPLPRPRTHNAVASAITESGTITQEPFRDLGLDGSGEVVQVVDTGLDELSCFFIDQTGAVQHSTVDEPIADLDRRKVVQYIEYPSGDGKDTEPGHGTHVASSVAGEVFKGWKASSDCLEGEQTDCFGVCGDSEYMASKGADEEWDLNLYCQDLGCDGGWVDYQEFTQCLDGGPSDAPLSGGVARGAKIAFFDVSGEDDATVLDLPYPDGVLLSDQR